MNEIEELAEVLKSLPDESARAHAAFKAYVGLGSRRSIDRAYSLLYTRRQEGDIEGTPRRRAPTFFANWASRFKWRERAEAYEAMLEAEYIRTMRDAHYAELSLYQADRLKQGKQLGELSAAMVVYCAKELKRLHEGNVPMDCDQLSRFLRSTACVSVAATEARADGLSVRQLTQQLEENRKVEALNNYRLEASEQE